MKILWLGVLLCSWGTVGATPPTDPPIPATPRLSVPAPTADELDPAEPTPEELAADELDPAVATATPDTAEPTPEELAAAEAARRQAEIAARRAQLSGDAVKLFDYLHAEPLTAVCGVTPRHGALLQALYAAGNYQLRWHRQAALREQLVEQIKASADDGMKPERYYLAQLTERLTCNAVEQDLLMSAALVRYAYERTHGQLDPRRFYRDWSPTPKAVDIAQILHDGLEKQQLASALRQTAPQFSLYWALRDEYIRLRSGMEGNVGPTLSAGPVMRLGSRGPRVVQLRQRLKATGDLSPVNDAPPLEAAPVQQVNSGVIASAHASDAVSANLSDLFDESLDQAVKRFQRRHRISADGIVGPQTLSLLNARPRQNLELVRLNLERMRWMPHDLGARHIFVNLPSYEMQVVEADKVVLESRVIVGKQGSARTPTFSSEMNYLVLNPAWYVPPSIKRTLTADAARRRGMTVTRQGNYVSMRQPPGPNNPLGRVKFMFPNPHSVYLHDTPSKNLFNQTERHLSAGCVRVAKPYELTEYLLGRQGWSMEQIVRVSQAGRNERRVNLEETLPVHLVYLTLWVDHDGVLQSRRDIYGLDADQLEAMRRL